MEKLRDKLKEYNQEHLLRFFDDLIEEEQKQLLDQINAIDFEEVRALYELAVNKEVVSASSNIQPLQGETTIKDDWLEIGANLIKEGKYAVITMAGGQGSRLGHEGPKGTYILEYGINKSIFEIGCDKLKQIHKDYGVFVYWGIMTSSENHEATIEFFEKNNYFGYPKEKISFFQQGLLPMVDQEGKIIMDSKFNIKLGPNGNGGVIKALFDEGIVQKLESAGVEYIFIGGMDNILMPIGNPILIGFAADNNYLAITNTVVKEYAEEKVGVFCLKDGKPAMIEYSDMSEELANERDEAGNLVYSDANIIANIFNIKVIKDIQNDPLPYHVAFKKSDYIDADGNVIVPDTENAYKFETFLFDSFALLDKVGLIRSSRNEVFAPVKNKDGVDSPSTASKLYLDYYQDKS